MQRIRAGRSKAGRFGRPGLVELGSDESGIGLIESALASMVVLTVIFGIMDGSRAVYADHYVANAAQEASRYAMVRGATWGGSSCSATGGYSCTATAADVTNYVKSVTPMGFAANNLAVNSNWSGTGLDGSTCSASNPAQGCVVSVQVNYAFNFVLPLLPANTLVLTSTSSMTVQQ